MKNFKEQIENSGMSFTEGGSYKPKNKEEIFLNLAKCSEEERKFDENNKRISDRILKILRVVKSEEWYSELMEYLKEAETHNPFSIVRKPKGQFQEEDEFESLGGVWVEQSSSYPCEDCYYGTVTVKIDEKRYLEMPFAC